jgi:DNA-binding CsgD family transcriptional regulator
MFAQVLIVTFVFCLAVTVATVLLSRQLLSTYASAFLRDYFYYLAAFHAFALYGLWGQIVTRGLLAALETDAAAIEVVAGFLPAFGVPFLLVSWAMLLAMAGSMFGKPLKTAWHSVHVVVFLLLLLGSWLAVGWVRAEPGSRFVGLGALEAAAMIGVELVYFAAFLVLVARFGAAAEADKRRVFFRFAALMGVGFAARSLLAALLYLRANADRVFAPVRAEQATKAGIAHVLDRYGVTKRERQIVEKICLGKTNKQVADELFISLQTVKDHTHRIYSKIGINNRMQLVQLMNAAK